VLGIDRNAACHGVARWIGAKRTIPTSSFAKKKSQTVEWNENSLRRNDDDRQVVEKASGARRHTLL
jgi:hypothetical protein